jgi:hypothetical protein
VNFENPENAVALTYSDDMILIMNFDSTYAQEADAYYEEKWEIGHLALFYNP